MRRGLELGRVIDFFCYSRAAGNSARGGAARGRGRGGRGASNPRSNSGTFLGGDRPRRENGGGRPFDKHSQTAHKFVKLLTRVVS